MPANYYSPKLSLTFDPTGKRVLIVDDDVDLQHVLTWSLQQEGYEVACASNGAQALDASSNQRPDVIILDVMMPHMDGFETCLRLRAFCSAPIIFLSARNAERDIIQGLNFGGDDYLIKPFSLAELKARIVAVLRRSDESMRHPSISVFDDGVIYVNLQTQCVRKNGQIVSLAPKEYHLLAALVRHQGAVVTHQELLNEVWGPNLDRSRGYVPLYVRYVRQKLEDNASRPQYLHTRLGVGYYFCAPTDVACLLENGAAVDLDS
jgi:DNA-binding response OmpR family regulator